ncbi:MAG TPA: diaminopimelate epimerase [Thermoanaerobaculia bacterium]
MTGTGERGVGGLPCRFTKMSGAGNDFLVFDERVEVGPRETATIRHLCERGRGVGADGVLFLSVVTGDVPVVVAAYYNADGRPARFCANGTRCAARFGSLRLGTGVELTVRTGWGDIGATVRPGAQVTLRLPEPIAVGEVLPTFDPDEVLVERKGVAVSVGVPHLVVFTSGRTELNRIDLASLAPRLRHHPALPDGANVHFVAPAPGGRLAIRSWERGVEGETLACGSGVVAAAVVAASRDGIAPPVTVETRSGENLVVDFRLDGGVARDVTLTGDARVVFEGTLNEEVL